jgi:hypothetical protein
MEGVDSDRWDERDERRPDQRDDRDQNDRTSATGLGPGDARALCDPSHHPFTFEMSRAFRKPHEHQRDDDRPEGDRVQRERPRRRTDHQNDTSECGSYDAPEVELGRRE